MGQDQQLDRPHRIFVGNFQGSYMRPGKQWELRNCKQ
jgi:hypothetical protein